MEKPVAINLSDLHFYFDSQAKDRFDVAGPSRRSSEVIALREKLMALPDRDFDAAIRTIQKLTEGAKPMTHQERLAEDRAQRQNARQLFERTESIHGGSGATATQVEKI